MEQVSGNIVRLESQKRSGYERYVLGKLSKEKFLELKQDAENEIETFRQTKAEKEKELAVVQEELQQKKQIAGNTEVLLTVDKAWDLTVSIILFLPLIPIYIASY